MWVYPGGVVGYPGVLGYPGSTVFLGIGYPGVYGCGVFIPSVRNLLECCLVYMYFGRKFKLISHEFIMVVGQMGLFKLDNFTMASRYISRWGT